jgi:Peptidase family M23/Abnormal spindle-like microcephaly-assoc'd, ASPM-SPD-2-Hydin
VATVSAGTYRIPYQNGTTVEITGDHLTHDPPTRIDMKGVAGSEPYRLVAAADGVIRFIVDQFGANRPDGNPCNNNYVWIEHDNGEWTKYSHMTKRSVTRDAGLSVGQRVRAGTFLGIEDDIGCAHGEHLHFEVAVPIDPDDPIDDAGLIRGGSPRNRIPRIGGIPSQLFVEGNRYVAANCPALVVHPTVLTFGSVAQGQSSSRSVRVTNLAGRDVTVSLAGPPPGSVFTWSPFTRVLDNQDATTFTIVFTNRSNAIERGTLRLTSDAAGSPHTVSMTGKGIGGIPQPPPDPPPPAELTYRPALLNFGSVSIGGSRTLRLAIENTTGRTASISVTAAPAGPFGWQAFSASLAHGATREVDVTFHPASNAIAQGTLLITSNTAGSPQPIGLLGKGPGGFVVPSDPGF